MLRSTFSLLAFSCLVIATAVSPVQAQVDRTVRLAGTVETVGGGKLTLKTAESQRTVRLAPTAPVFALVKATLADVKPGVFVGVGATPQPDDTQRAIRVTIFAESMRGLGEGHRPWDRPGTTMTNATVDTAVTSVDGHLVTVKYKGGEKKIVIRPDTIIVTYVDADRSQLASGANVTVSGTLQSNGEVEASRVVIDRTAAAAS